MWNPLPKTGLGRNPLPKLGLMLFTLEDTPNLALLKLEFERQAMGSVNIHFASNLFCWGRLVSILKKKNISRMKNGKA